MEEISADSPRIGTGATTSPEFEFWLLDKNPPLPPPGLLTADQLFVDGVLLPLDFLSLSQTNTENLTHESEPEIEIAPPLPPPVHISPCSDPSANNSPPTLKIAMKWKDLKDLFKVGEKTLEEIRERRNQKRRDSVGAAEINIHIWPFSRSRSAGNAGAAAGLRTSRKVSSAPCSRSNSRGESSKPTGDAAAAAASSSSSRRWTARPVDFSGGIRLGRTGPVVKLRRKTNPNPNPNPNPIQNSDPNPNQSEPKEMKADNAGVRGLNFNVNTCIGYRNQQVSCKVFGNCDNGEEDGGAANRRGNIGSLFNLRSIFSKKVY